MCGEGSPASCEKWRCPFQATEVYAGIIGPKSMTLESGLDDVFRLEYGPSTIS
jgi:hypothetical protein